MRLAIPLAMHGVLAICWLVAPPPSRTKPTVQREARPYLLLVLPHRLERIEWCSYEAAD